MQQYIFSGSCYDGIDINTSATLKLISSLDHFSGLSQFLFDHYTQLKFLLGPDFLSHLGLRFILSFGEAGRLKEVKVEPIRMRKIFEFRELEFVNSLCTGEILKVWPSVINPVWPILNSQRFRSLSKLEQCDIIWGLIVEICSPSSSTLLDKNVDSSELKVLTISVLCSTQASIEDSWSVLCHESNKTREPNFLDRLHVRDQISCHVDSPPIFPYTTPNIDRSFIDRDNVCRSILKSNSLQKTPRKGLWNQLTKACTLLIPSCLLRLFGIDETAEFAWREKLTLFSIIILLNLSILTAVIGVTTFLCPEQNVISMDEFKLLASKSPFCIVHGVAYNLEPYCKSHNFGKASPLQIFTRSGQDLSYLFPPFPNDVTTEHNYFHSNDSLFILKGLPEKYNIGFSPTDIEHSVFSPRRLFNVGRVVYDVTALRRLAALSDSAKSAIREPVRSETILNKFSPTDLKFLELFRVGILDLRRSTSCRCSSYLLIGSSFFLVTIILFKFLAALQLGLRRIPEKTDKFVLIQIPCYSENEISLRKTIDSAVKLRYDDKRKLLFIVADGIITGAGNDKSTAHLLAEILGIDATQVVSREFCKSYSSVNNDVNYVNVFSGLYECSGHRVPYIFVVKIGQIDEKVRSGNRGKRDSQLILLRFLEKIYYDYEFDPTDHELYWNFTQIIGIDPSAYEFILMLDADTEVMEDSLVHMVSTFSQDSLVIGLCGETRLANESKSFITMLQVYEYFISHNLTKAFESIFGCVTCLPGCFSMYRLRTIPELGNVPILIKTELLDAYSKRFLISLHEKNLLGLGEDRYLTTLLLKHFPRFKLQYISEASCNTIAPESWSVLLSQRRRWINSTIHNLFELLSLSSLCGTCCFSMRFLVIIDLLGTFVMPASVIYIFYLIYQSLHYKSAPTISLLLILISYGIQSMIFIIKGRWQYIGWLAIHILSFPVTNFIIPIYAYWNFDDFTWGYTRRTDQELKSMDFTHL